MIFSTIKNHFHGFVLLTFFIAISNVSSWAMDGKFRNNITWKEISSIPPAPGTDVQHGLAAPFAGFSNGVLIVAGGCNFPNAPVYEGGTKKYYNDIFVFDESSQEPQWTSGYKFPYAIAYGASVTIDEGLVCIGGKNPDKEFAEVHLLRWNKKAPK